MKDMGQITLDTTGTGQEFTLGFRPTWAKLTVGQKYGTTETASHLSLGTIINGVQHCDSIFSDPTSATTVSMDDRVVHLKARVSGSVTTVLDASFNSFTADGIKLDVNVANTNYPVTIEFGD